MISPSLFRQRHFLLFVGGSAGSWATVYVQSSVYAFLILALTEGPFLFGSVGSVFGWTSMGGDLLPLLLALPLGVLIDRVRRRSVLVAMSLLGAVLLASVPVATWLGVATWPHVALVGVIIGMLQGTSIAHDAYLPTVVGRDRLVSANTVLTVAPMIVLPGAMLASDRLMGDSPARSCSSRPWCSRSRRCCCAGSTPRRSRRGRGRVCGANWPRACASP
ncbi:hypothetical protein ACFQX6_48655 [Streptosporangium lutulentum]